MPRDAVSGQATHDDVLPLTGYSIALTADRRREEISSLLERRGARVVSAPTFRMAPLEDDSELLRATRQCVDPPLDVVIATTGVGFRRWLESADGWGLGDILRSRLHDARIVARGPKARGAIRHAGLIEEWSPSSESVAEVIEHLVIEGIRGQRVAVQLHGERMESEIAALERAGAVVLPVPVYRWSGPEDPGAVMRMIRSVIAGEIDAVVFTSAPAVNGLVDAARGAGLEDPLLRSLATQTVTVCIGPICASPFAPSGVVPVFPTTARTGSLIRCVAEQVPARRGIRLRCAGKEIDVRGHAVVAGDTVTHLSAAPMAILCALARRAGTVVTRDELVEELSPDAGPHAVEMAVARLRSVLPDPDIVQTVVKRGYRLTIDE